MRWRSERQATCTDQSGARGSRETTTSALKLLFGDAMEMTRAVDEAEKRLQGIVSKTPLQPSSRLSERYEANILIKREDMQAVRSFKIRGAYNKIASLPPEDRKRPIVCASAGNHAQGVAFACAHLGIGGTIVMPTITPTQKIEREAHFGGEVVEIRLAREILDDDH